MQIAKNENATSAPKLTMRRQNIDDGLPSIANDVPNNTAETVIIIVKAAITVIG